MAIKVPIYSKRSPRPRERSSNVTSILTQQDKSVIVSELSDADEKILLALGYKQEFKRDFSIWRSLAISFSVLGILPSIAGTMGFNFGYSGLAGAVWGWFTAATWIQFVALSLAELCSSMPTAGGLYYASAVLAPAGWGPLCSWITGWSNFLGYALGPLSIDYVCSLLVFAAATIADPNFVTHDYQVYLLTLAFLIVDGLLDSTSTRSLGLISSAGAVVNLVLVILVIVWLPAGSVNPLNTASEVWTGITNGTDWPAGFAFLLGFTSVTYTLAGYDTSFHLSEECSNANVASPRAIIMTAQLGLYLGWAVIIVMAYTITDLSYVVAGPLGSPLASVCLQALGKKSGLALLSLSIVAQFFVGQSVLVTASRITYAYSRDGAILGSRWWKQVNGRTKTPVNAVWLVVAVDALIGLLIFAGPIAINAVFTIVAIGNYVAFCMPILLKLISGRDRFVPGPWNLGRFSVPINIAACCFGALMVPVMSFPAVKGSNLTPQTMNWTCLLYGGCMLFALCWYAVSARKWFKGPKINADDVLSKAATTDAIMH